VLLNWLLKKTLSQSPPLRSGRPRATWAAPRPCPASPPPPSTFPPCRRWRGRSGPPRGPQGRRRRGHPLSAAAPLRGGRAEQHDLAGFDLDDCDRFGFPRAGSMARDRGGPEGGVDDLAAAPARGAQILRPLARIPPSRIGDGQRQGYQLRLRWFLVAFGSQRWWSSGLCAGQLLRAAPRDPRWAVWHRGGAAGVGPVARSAAPRWRLLLLQLWQAADG
jgi:hypothetical protein